MQTIRARVRDRRDHSIRRWRARCSSGTDEGCAGVDARRGGGAPAGAARGHEGAGRGAPAGGGGAVGGAAAAGRGRQRGLRQPPNPALFPKQAVFLPRTWDASIRSAGLHRSARSPGGAPRGAGARLAREASAASCWTHRPRGDRGALALSESRAAIDTALPRRRQAPRSRTGCAACCSRTAAPPASS